MRHFKNFLKFLPISLLFVLVACSGVETNQATPIKESVKSEASEVNSPLSGNQPQEGAETAGEAAKGGDDTLAKAEKPAGEEAMVASSEKKEVPMAEPAATTEAMPEKTETAPNAAPTVEKTMTSPANTTPAGPTEAQLKLLAGLESRGTPPELFNEVWLNSEPLKLADLHGQVVIVEFWTFG